MKSNYKLPPLFREISYRVIPQRRRVTAVLKQLDEVSLNLQETHDLVASLVKSKEGKLIARPGGTESEGLYHYLGNRFSRRSSRSASYPKFFLENAPRYSGVTYQNQRDLDRFNFEYLRGILNSDLLAYGQFAPGSLGLALAMREIGIQTTNFRHLEPWEALNAGIEPWTNALSGLRVGVVHPFVKSITSNFQRRRQINGVRKILPDFHLVPICPPVSLTQDSDSPTWMDNFSELRANIRSQSESFDVALVGAGSYGLPISHEISNLGKPAVHLGGSLQLLFGIGGKRWLTGYAVSKHIDATWSRPDPSDVRPGTEAIEGGSYH